MEPCVESSDYPHLGGNIDGGDPFTYCPKLWEWLPGNSMRDIGCAQGHALNWFAANGYRVHGLEGLAANVSRCNHPVVCHDIQSGPIYLPPVDLIWCCELVEHIEEQFLCNLLPLLVAPTLAMTYAEVDQDGHHHVNCQPAAYWIRQLATVGMEYDPVATTEARGLDGHNNHFGWHGLVFRRAV